MLSQSCPRRSKQPLTENSLPRNSNWVSKKAAEEALHNASSAIDLDTNDLESRYLVARALNKLGGPENETSKANGQLAAILLEIMVPLGWDRERSSLDEGFARRSEWKYADSGAPQPENWHAFDFDDSSWKTGQGSFGFGDGREVTLLASGTESNRPITSYYRKKFTVSSPEAFSYPRIYFQRDDGTAIYINGIELARENLPKGKIDSTTKAKVAIGAWNETRWNSVTFPSNRLRQGDNIVAVELHQSSSSSSDAHFDLELFANRRIGSDLLTIDVEKLEAMLARATPLTKTLQSDFRAIFQMPTSSARQEPDFHWLARASRFYTMEDYDAAHVSS